MLSPNVGSLVPAVNVGRIVNEQMELVEMRSHLAGRRSVVIGVPGAFTPVCTREHIPEFVAQADTLRAAGFGRIICLASNDPWTVRVWADMLDPACKVEFLADGNLELARALGATARADDLMLGERSRRFMMVVRDGVIERFVAEMNPLHITCTRASDLLLAA